jgi:SET and MYND domain-containing protein
MTSPTFISTELYELQETPSSGRGVFARKAIPANISILKTDLLPAYVVNREYSREVCARCFAYNHSREFKLKILETGHSFCGKDCLRAWKADTGDVGLGAWTAVEAFVRGRSARPNGGSMEGNVYDMMPDEGAARPSPEEIRGAWEEAEGTAALIREARDGSKQKVHRKALRIMMSLQMYPDTLTFLLSGMLVLANEKRTRDWQSVLELVPDATPYTSPQDLAKNIRSFLHLLSVLPLALLPHVTAENCFTLVSRDSHNSFGIRSLDDNGSEMFGFGVWPIASYFNHSCEPNVGKRRVGRGWEFWTAQGVEEGEELCISYMGGDERDLNLGERRGRTKEIWGFVCACMKCVVEEEEEEEELELATVGSDGSGCL